MGKSVFSIISSLVTVAIVVFLIYLCCLRKKRNGQVFRTMIIGTNPPPVTQPQQYLTQPTQVWPTFGHPTAQQHHYPPQNYTGAPYPTVTAQHVGTGMPMPTPMPNSAGGSYPPSAPAPSAPMPDDLPPPYSSVIRGS